MESHFLLLVLFSLFVSLVLGVIMREDPRSQLHVGAKLFAAFVGAAVVIGWLMYVFPL